MLLFLAMLMFAPEPVKVMTFNVRYPAQGDGANVWPLRRDLMVDLIRLKAPDIIGTQELFYEQGQYLVEKLPEYAWFGLSRRGNQTDEHMGVFYRKDRLTLLDSGNFWLSETPDQPGSQSWGVTLPRMATWGRFRQAGGTEFYFYNTHFAHRREDENARTEMAKVLAARIAALPKDVPVVLTGDFNTVPESAAYQALALLKDAWKEAAVRLGSVGTFHGFSGTPGAQRIDWVLFRGPWRAASAETVTWHSGSRYPSDHFPVQVVLAPQ